MMGQVFLGKPAHWALVALLILGGWYLGHARLHVIWFNLFTVLLFAGSAAALAFVLWTSRTGERITRDPLEPDPD